jgi:Peptidase M15
MSTSLSCCRTPWLAILAAITMIGCLPLSSARAESEGPTARYASLPGDGGATTTGSLPDGTRSFRTLSTFASAVESGTIELRGSAPTQCLPGSLTAVLADVSARFGTVSIQSTHRSSSRNRQAGGARQSLHLSCRAIDFRIRSRVKGVMAYLRSRPEVGGLKVYRNGIIHIDNGSRRSW